MEGRKNKKNNYNGGQVMLTMVIFFLIISTTIVFGIANPILKQIQISKDLANSKRSYFLAEGSVEDIIYRIRTNKQVLSSETFSNDDGSVSSTVVSTPTTKEIVATASVNDGVRKIRTNLILGTGVSFYYGVQSGQGGFTLSNSSSIVGSVYSAGPITGNGNYIYGDVISAGDSGLIYGIHATGTARSHTLGNSSQVTIIDKDAYYQHKTNTTVGGTSNPNSPDNPIIPMPISDEQIVEWENIADAGGSVTCSGGTYIITSDVTIGPKKIPCDLEISGSPTVTITGYIWVTGNITIRNSSKVKMAASLGNRNVAIIADKPSDRLNSCIITVANSASFQNSGTAGSFVFLVSMNNSAENGGSVEAFSLSNSASAMVAYAPHGLIPLANSVSLKEVTGYKINLRNSAVVRYDTGLPSTLFSSGPTGGYEISRWEETQ